MRSRQARKSPQVADASSVASGAELVPQGSNDQTSADMLSTARNLISSSKRRREAKRIAIKAEHEKRTEAIKAKANALFETRENRATKYQQAQWARLEALSKKRQSLEKLIFISMRSIELHMANISSELAAMYTGRLDELADGCFVEH